MARKKKYEYNEERAWQKDAYLDSDSNPELDIKTVEEELELLNLDVESKEYKQAEEYLTEVKTKVVDNLDKVAKDRKNGVNEIAEREGIDLETADFGQTIYHNNLIQQQGGPHIKKFIDVNIVLMNMEPVDLHDPAAVWKRVHEYLYLYYEGEMKPTVAGLGIALGLDTRRLHELRNGKVLPSNKKLLSLPRETVDCVLKSYNFIENIHESNMVENKINPAVAIFMAKNHYGYRDQQDISVTPNTDIRDEVDVDDIKKRYE